MQTNVVISTSPGMMMIHQQLVSSTSWDMDKRLPQDTVVRGSPRPRKTQGGFGDHGLADIGHHHEHDG